jgi:hypothetical protein
MKKYALIGVVVVLVAGLVGLVVRAKFFQPAQAGLRVTSNPPATVFLDGQEMGQTTFEKEDLKPGEKTLRLVPQAMATTYFPWETKVKLVNKTMVIVNRDFGETESLSAGEVMSLETIADKKSASLAVISNPDSVVVSLNNETKGFTPLNQDNLSEGTYEIRLAANGYQERLVRVNLRNGFRLVVNVKLAEEKEEETETEGEEAEEEEAEEEGAEATVTPTPKAKVTPPPRPYVLIKDTPTGWLRVRMGPTIAATEAAKVDPGEMFPLLDEESGWYKVEYEEGEEGWVSGQYAEKYE